MTIPSNSTRTPQGRRMLSIDSTFHEGKVAHYCLSSPWMVMKSFSPSHRADTPLRS